jgi:hypothetical protein
MERNVDFEIVERKKNERLAQMKVGKPAPRYLLVLGWAFSLLGGIIGFGIGWSLCFMKEKTPEGEFHTYDAKARDYGKGMLFLGGLVVLFALFCRMIGRYHVR